jgi:3-hydroxyisobutyrate dehydrogenase
MIPTTGSDPDAKTAMKRHKGENLRVGFVGLGVMGYRMAMRLVSHGIRLTVYNRSKSAMDRIAKSGARPARNLGEIAKSCNVIFLSLPSTRDVENVTIGKSGLLSELRTGSIIVDTSTIDPQSTKRIESKLRTKKCRFLDAPVSGGPEGAELGSLTFMVGGNRRSFSKIKRVLKILGQEIVYIGNSGSGQKMKLLNQSLVACYFVAAAESYRWSRKIKLDQNDILKVLSKSWGDSPVLRHFMKTLRSKKLGGGARIRILKKDVSLVLRNSEKDRVKMKLLKTVNAKLSRAIREGLGDMDATALWLLRD